MVDQKRGLALDPRGLGEALHHRFLERVFEPRRVLRSGDEAEGENSLGLHLAETATDQILAHSCFDHVSQVAEKGECAELVLGQKALERLLLIPAGAQPDLPRVGGGESVLSDLLKQHRLCLILRLRVAEEEDVAELELSALTPVLRERVFGELSERSSDPLLELRGLALPAGLAIEGKELSHLIWSLDHSGDEVSDLLSLVVAQGVASEEQRDMAELESLAGIDCTLGEVFERDRFAQDLDSISDRLPVLVELVLEEHVGHDGAAELPLGVEDRARGALVRAGLRSSDIGLHKCLVCYRLREAEGERGTSKDCKDILAG